MTKPDDSKKNTVSLTTQISNTLLQKFSQYAGDKNPFLFFNHPGIKNNEVNVHSKNHTPSHTKK